MGLGKLVQIIGRFEKSGSLWEGVCLTGLVARQALPCYTAVARLGFKRRATSVPNSIHKL